MLLNDEIYRISGDDLPCLITYGEKAGGSQFSVSMIADLFLRGERVLFLTAYPMAKDDFYDQIKGEESKTAFITDEDLLDSKVQAIILESGNEELYLKAVRMLDDIQERIVFIKNMEVFSSAVFDSCLKFSKVILSGDIDKCSDKKRISETEFKTVVAFSKPVDMSLPFALSNLEKYTGYLWSKNKEGLVRLKMN